MELGAYASGTGGPWAVTQCMSHLSSVSPIYVSPSLVGVSSTSPVGPRPIPLVSHLTSVKVWSARPAPRPQWNPGTPGTCTHTTTHTLPQFQTRHPPHTTHHHHQSPPPVPPPASTHPHSHHITTDRTRYACRPTWRIGRAAATSGRIRYLWLTFRCIRRVLVRFRCIRQCWQ